ncbi:hypothetical protein [Bacillus sp. REN3]|nr:hypothetical protein [Bacillus sp. REN3]
MKFQKGGTDRRGKQGHISSAIDILQGAVLPQGSPIGESISMA